MAVVSTYIVGIEPGADITKEPRSKFFKVYERG